MSLHRSMLLSMMVLCALACFTATASARKARGPITGVIGRGEEGQTGGSGNGELAGPAGVAIDQGTESVYVVDQGNNRVEKYEASGTYLSQFNGSATPEGSFSGPTAVAVDQGTGDVYVADTGHNVVDKFTSAGIYICELSGVGRGCQASPAGLSTFSAPVGVAVDPTSGHPTSGDVYVSDRENRAVDVFTELGGDVAQLSPGVRPRALAVDSEGDVYVALAGSQISEYTPGATELIGEFGEGARAVGVDLQTGHIFVGTEVEEGGEYKIGEFDATRSHLGNFGGGLMSAPGLGGLPGIAVSSAANVVYAADTGNNVVDMYGEVSIPEATTCSAKAVQATSATLGGEVNPEGTSAEYSFRYGPSVPFAFETPFALVGGGAEVTENIPVESEVTGLIPGTKYDCKLVATNSSGLLGESSLGTFETPPLPPSIEEPISATEATPQTVILSGSVNPGNGSTFYHFAYGSEAGNYTHVLPSIGISVTLESIPVAQAIPPGSLLPNTTIHFALIASNPSGTTTSPDQTFTTAGIGTPPDTPPVLSTGPAESIAQNSATLTGTVYPEATPTYCCFHLGIDPTYGTLIFTGEAGREQGLVSVTRPISGLQPGTTYHYALECFSLAGATIGPDRSFTTTTFPQEIFQPATPGLVPIPVFPKVKNPVIKHPKHPKKKKHKPKRPRAHGHKAKARRAHRR